MTEQNASVFLVWWKRDQRAGERHIHYNRISARDRCGSDSCERSGANEADEALSEIHQEMKQLANAINALPVNSIEGLRAKALVAFREVAPLCAGDTEFSFDDA